MQSIRRNKAAAAALLADYRDPAEGVIDGVTAAQEAKYNEHNYLVSNRYVISAAVAIQQLAKWIANKLIIK